MRDPEGFTSTFALYLPDCPGKPKGVARKGIIISTGLQRRELRLRGANLFVMVFTTRKSGEGWTKPGSFVPCLTTGSAMSLRTCGKGSSIYYKFPAHPTGS